MFIQKLRLKRGWSQQQLADASGLSARTIQRIENGHAASTESLKSLAAVFEVDFSMLNPDASMATTNSPLTTLQEEDAFKYVRKLRRFYIHLFQYLFTVLVLLAINLILTPKFLWVLFVIGGWGLGLISHAFFVFRPDWLLGPQWEKKQIEKRLGRSL